MKLANEVLELLKHYPFEKEVLRAQAARETGDRDFMAQCEKCKNQRKLSPEQNRRVEDSIHFYCVMVGRSCEDPNDQTVDDVDIVPVPSTTMTLRVPGEVRASGPAFSPPKTSPKLKRKKSSGPKYKSDHIIYELYKRKGDTRMKKRAGGYFGHIHYAKKTDVSPQTVWSSTAILVPERATR